MIPLDKKPGLRPIGVGEILRRIAEKVVVSVIGEDVITSVGSLQVCDGHKAAVHTMQEIFEEKNTEAVLLVIASNAFNSVNRNATLHNMSIICPDIATYCTYKTVTPYHHDCLLLAVTKSNHLKALHKEIL